MCVLESQNIKDKILKLHHHDKRPKQKDQNLIHTKLGSNHK
jgi:hypothetical protein